MILRLFKDSSRGLEAFDYNCEVFIKIMSLIEDIIREMEASIRNRSLFKRL
jgi:hypothetical protein